MNKEEAVKYAESLENAVTDSPFEEDFETVVFRHSDTKKWFGLVIRHDDKQYLNLKCDPDLSDLLKREYEGIIPAYHMNKRLWITVILGSDVPDEETKRLIKHSYELTSKKKKSK